MRRTLRSCSRRISPPGGGRDRRVCAGGRAAPAAPIPTFKITGFIDEVITYSNNTSNFDLDLHRKDTCSTAGRAVGSTSSVSMARPRPCSVLELDFVYGQTGTGNTNIATVQGGATTNPATGGGVARVPGD